MTRLKTTAERGKFKQIIHKALFENENIREMIIGDFSKMSKIDQLKTFKEYVKSHLFIDDTITESKTFIFYDIELPDLHENIKDCRISMYLICNRDLLENYEKNGYYGDRIDILSQMVEEALINNEKVSQKFGIGKLTLDSVNIYNATRFYGCILEMSVPNFR